MENIFTKKLVYGFSAVVLFYVAFSLKKIVGWVTPAVIVQLLGSEFTRSQPLALLQYFIQPVSICLGVGFLLVSFGVIKNNTLVRSSLYISLSVALLYVAGQLFLPILSLYLFAWFFGPAVGLSALLLLAGIVKNISSSEVSVPTPLTTTQAGPVVI